MNDLKQKYVFYNIKTFFSPLFRMALIPFHPLFTLPPNRKQIFCQLKFFNTLMTVVFSILFLLYNLYNKIIKEAKTLKLMIISYKNLKGCI